VAVAECTPQVHFFVVANRRHFTFGMWVNSHPTDDKPSRNGRGHIM